jgi:hypothetical protein
MKTTQMIPPFFGEYGDKITFSTSADCRPDAPEIAWWPGSIAFRKSKEQGERFVLNLYLKWAFKKSHSGLRHPYRSVGRTENENLISPFVKMADDTDWRLPAQPHGEMKGLWMN